jgi:hypothetical protein
MLELLDTTLLTMRAANNKIEGRTAIQKLIYFESIFKVVDIKYRPYYYGPYSSDLTGIIETAVALKFIKEDINVLPADIPDSIEMKKYGYTLTDDGIELAKQLVKEHQPEYQKIKRVVDICKDNTGLDVNTLSYAAKIHYILHTKKKPMTMYEITDTANSFGWKLSLRQANRAKHLLKALGLCGET